MTLGEHVRLLQRDENWNRLQLGIDKTYFLRRLDTVRTIRNEIMHFSPDPIKSDDIGVLRQFTAFLQKLQMTLPAG